MIEKYDEEDIATAVTNCVDSWDMDTLVSYATEMLYKEYMDRSQPIEHIDELMEEWGPKGHKIVDNEGYFGA